MASYMSTPSIAILAFIISGILVAITGSTWFFFPDLMVLLALLADVIWRD